MNVVLTLDEKSLKSLMTRFQKNQLPTKNPYLHFFAKIGKTSVSVYTSGKVVFQGVDAERLAGEFGYAMQELPVGQENIIGTDEVGNGSYFGGLIVVASFIDAERLTLLEKLGVADSKTLSDNKICQIAPSLIENVEHISLVVEPHKYNEVIESGYNAVSIKVALHNQAIFLLERKLKIKPENVVIDAFTSRKNYERYVQKEKNQVTSSITLLTKAEHQFLAVACSSVIARYLFLEDLKRLSSESGFHLPSGAGALSDKIAAKILKRSGIESLSNFAKLHFANTQKALQLSKKESED